MRRRDLALAIPALLCMKPGWATESSTPTGAVTCPGYYPHHLQGVCLDEEAIFWSFTTRMVKTDRAGKRITEVPAANHHGDLCHHDGKIYVAVNLGKFNDPGGKADSWVYVYSARDLTLLSRHPVPELIYGAGGIAYHAGKFLVVGGLSPGSTANRVYLYDPAFKLDREISLPGGYTLMGIQTATFADDHWWFGCYGEPKILLKANEALNRVEHFQFDASLGIVPTGMGRLLVARGTHSRERGHTGRLVPASTDSRSGLVER